LERLAGGDDFVLFHIGSIKNAEMAARIGGETVCVIKTFLERTLTISVTDVRTRGL
jgi:hypothetical protein